jgi:hypothetical protein
MGENVRSVKNQEEKKRDNFLNFLEKEKKLVKVLTK